MRPVRLRWQLAAGMALVALTLMGAATVILAARSDDLRRTEATIGVQRDAEVLAAQVEPRLETNRPFGQLLTSTGSRLAEVVDGAGRRLAGDDFAGEPRIADAVSDAINEIGVSSLDDDRGGVAVAGRAIGIEPVLVDDELRGVIVVGEDLPQRHGWRSLYGMDALAAGLLAMAAAALGWWLAGRITRPLQHLTDQARALVLGSPARSGRGAPRPHIAEVAVLSAAFDDIASRIAHERSSRDHIDGELRRLSHEMRTPLTTLRLRLDDRLDIADESEGQRCGRADAPVIVGQLDRLDRLGDELSRLRLQRDEFSVVDVSVTAQAVVSRLRPLADWGRVELTVDSRAPSRAALTFADPVASADAIANVVGNAIKFSPRNGRVRVRVLANPDGVCVEVADTGPGIAAPLRSVIVHAGVRVLGRHHVVGTGQGLAIVAATLDRCGGRLELTDNPGGGALVRLLFPHPAIERSPLPGREADIRPSQPAHAV
jgi:signal transduction histidine kinase